MSINGIDFVFNGHESKEYRSRAKDGYLHYEDLTALMKKIKKNSTVICENDKRWKIDGKTINLPDRAAFAPTSMKRRFHDFKMHLPYYRKKIDRKIQKIVDAHNLAMQARPPIKDISSSSESAAVSSSLSSSSSESEKKVEPEIDFYTLQRDIAGFQKNKRELELKNSSLEKSAATLKEKHDEYLNLINRLNVYLARTKQERVLLDEDYELFKQYDPGMTQEDFFDSKKPEALAQAAMKEVAQCSMALGDIGQQQDDNKKRLEALNLKLKDLSAELPEGQEVIFKVAKKTPLLSLKEVEAPVVPTPNKKSFPGQEVYEWFSEPIPGDQFPLIGYICLQLLKNYIPQMVRDATNPNIYTFTFPPIEGIIKVDDSQLPIGIPRLALRLEKPVVVEYLPSEKKWMLKAGLEIDVDLKIAVTRNFKFPLENVGLVMEGNSLRVQYTCQQLKRILQPIVNDHSLVDPNEVYEFFNQADAIVWKPISGSKKS